MYEFNSLSEKTINKLREDLKEKLNIIIPLISQKNFERDRLLFKNEKHIFADICYITNNGTIRSINFRLTTKDEKNKVVHLWFYLEDKSQGCGKYQSEDKTYGKYPLAWQSESFTHFQYFGMYQAENIRMNLAQIDLYTFDFQTLNKFQDLLNPLFIEFYRTNKDVLNRYDKSNLESRKRSFLEKQSHYYREELLKLEDSEISYITPIFNDREPEEREMTSWNFSKLIQYNKDTSEMSLRVIKDI